MGQNTTGGDSVCIGSQAGAQINDSYNVFIGYYAGKDKDSGQSNVAIGHGAGDALTTGTNNVAAVSYTHLTLPTNREV